MRAFVFHNENITVVVAAPRVFAGPVRSAYYPPSEGRRAFWTHVSWPSFFLPPLGLSSCSCLSCACLSCS